MIPFFDVSAFFPGLHHASYLLLALAVLIEGPVATLTGAALSASGILHTGPALAAVIAGNMSGDLFWYLIGRAGRFASLAQRIPGLRRFNKRIILLLHTVRRHPLKIVITSKLWFGVAVIPALIASGMARISLRQLFPALFCCEIIWSGLLFSLGYLLAASLPRVTAQLEHATTLAGVLLALALILLSGWFLHRKSGLKQKT